MIGGIEETSASFEARSAPRSYPTDPIGPKPCVAVRKDGGEASVGECIGQPLSLVKIHTLGVDAVAKAEGNTYGHGNASARTARRGRRTWHVHKLVAREPGDPTPDQWQQRVLVRIGKARSRSR